MNRGGVEVEIVRRETVARRNNVYTGAGSVTLRLSCGHSKVVPKGKQPKGERAYCRQCLDGCSAPPRT